MDTVRVVVWGTLAGVVLMAGVAMVVALPGRPRSHWEKTPLTDLVSLRMALEVFNNIYDRYPTQEEGLQALVSPPRVDGRNYASFVTEIGKDTWGREYRYRAPAVGRKGRLYSLGPDGLEGTKDDIWIDFGEPTTQPK